MFLKKYRDNRYNDKEPSHGTKDEEYSDVTRKVHRDLSISVLTVYREALFDKKSFRNLTRMRGRSKLIESGYMTDKVVATIRDIFLPAEICWMDIKEIP